MKCHVVDAVYRVKTQQKSGDRIRGHKNTKTQTALYKNNVENKHTFCFDNIKILKLEKNNR